MTVSTSTSRIAYTGNGVTTSFSVPFPFIQDDYLIVIRTVIATGVETILTLDSVGPDGYSVTGAGGPSGNVIVVTAPTALERLSIIRSVDATQEADFVANDPLPSEVIEDSLDKLTMLFGDLAGANGLSRVPILYAGDIDGSGRYNSNGNRYSNAADGVSPDDLATLQQVISAGSGNFIQSGTGAVIRTMQNKARDVVNFKDFGAVCDGTTDDTAAVISAIEFANSQRSEALFGNDVMLVGEGVILVSQQINLSNCNIDLQGGKFKLSPNFPVSPAIIVNEGNGNSWASRVIRISVDGDRDNQSVSPLVACLVNDLNWTGTDVRIHCYDCDDGVKVTGNTENQVIHVSGSKVNRLVVEDVDGANQPDENIYFISGNTCKQLFVQLTAGMSSSCILNFNCEQSESGASDYPVVIRSNKAVSLFGIIRGYTHTGGVRINGGLSLMCYFGGLSMYATGGGYGLLVDQCGTLDGSIQLNSADGGGANIQDVNNGGNFSVTVLDFEVNPACVLGSVGTATSRVEELNLVLSASGPTGAVKDLVCNRAQDCVITMMKVTNGVDITTYATGCHFYLPREVITNNVPVTGYASMADFISGIEIRGAFSDAQLAAYSTPLVGMRVTNDRASRYGMAFYGGTAIGWARVSFDSITADYGNNSATLNFIGDSPRTGIWNTPFTGNRTAALSTASVPKGAKFRVVRTAAATGAFTLDVGTGPLKALSAGQWCDVEYNGSAWVLTAFGSL